MQILQAFHMRPKYEIDFELNINLDMTKHTSSIHNNKISNRKLEHIEHLQNIHDLYKKLHDEKEVLHKLLIIIKRGFKWE